MNLKIILIIAAVAIGAVIMYASRPSKGKHPIAHITPAKLDSILTRSAVQLLDVRTPEEFAEGHIAGAQNINVQAPDFLGKSARSIAKDRPVYIYCRSGKRSMTAAAMLSENGYRTINLDGGILAWQADSLPIVK